MNAAGLAALLNGREYRAEITKEESAQAKADEFDFSSIPDDDAEKFSTVQDVIDYVAKEIEK